MKKASVVCVLMCVMVGAASAAVTTVWNPAANPAGTGLWSEAANWTQGAIGAPMTQDGDWKPVFNVNGARECILDTAVTVAQLVMGDGGTLNGNFLRLVSGAYLTSGLAANGATNWTAIGYTRSATMTIETGAVLETKSYILIGRDGSDTQPPTGAYPSYLNINGGTAIIGGNCILGNLDATKTEGGGYVTVDDGGILDVVSLTINDTAVGGSCLNILNGTVKINGDVRGGINTMMLDGRIAGNNLTVEYVGGRTVITAIPEPATMALLALGGLALLRKKKTL
jgi:hypothetical protein